MFTDRHEAGVQLGRALRDVVREPAVVLGIPRGGVIVAAPVAAALGAPLDVVLTHKLGAPGNPELAIGAVAPGIRVIDAAAVRALGVPDAYVEDEVARQEREIARRRSSYRRGAPPPTLEGRTAVVVDDGIATGATAVAALRWARAAGAARVVLGAPVGPGGPRTRPRTRQGTRLDEECDACVVLETPPDLRSVGQWYLAFGQVDDDAVAAALEEARA